MKSRPFRLVFYSRGQTALATHLPLLILEMTERESALSVPTQQLLQHDEGDVGLVPQTNARCSVLSQFVHEVQDLQGKSKEEVLVPPTVPTQRGATHILQDMKVPLHRGLPKSSGRKNGGEPGRHLLLGSSLESVRKLRT